MKNRREITITDKALVRMGEVDAAIIVRSYREYRALGGTNPPEEVLKAFLGYYVDERNILSAIQWEHPTERTEAEYLHKTCKKVLKRLIQLWFPEFYKGWRIQVETINIFDNEDEKVCHSCNHPDCRYHSNKC